MTHAGYNSILEGAQSGVAMLFFPLFGDQYANSMRAQRLGCGLTLNIKSDHLSSEQISRAIVTLVEQPQWARNAARLARELQDQPISKEEELSWTIRQFVKTPASLITLRKGQRLGEFTYLGLDIVAAKFAVIFIAISVLVD